MAATLYYISTSVYSQAEQFRKDHKEEADSILSRELHEIYIDFVVDGAQELSRFAAISAETRKIADQTMELVRRGEDVEELRPKLKEAFDNAQITPAFDRRYRQTMGDSIERIVAYESLRQTINNASEKKMQESELFQRLSGLVAGIGAILIFGDLWDIDATAITLAVLGILLIAWVAAMTVGNLYSARKEAKAARKDFLERVGNEERGIAPFEIEDEREE